MFGFKTDKVLSIGEQVELHMEKDPADGDSENMDVVRWR